MDNKISADDIKFAKEMTKLEWALNRHVILPVGSSTRDEEILAAVSCEFAQKCILDFVSRIKSEFSRMPLSVEIKPLDEQPKTPPSMNEAYRLNFVKQLRPSVMIVGAGWKPVDSLHITYVEVQGMSLRKVTDNLLKSKANWEEVGQVMLLPDAMWSWRGNFQALNDFVTILRQRSPKATIYICGIPIYDSTKIEPWQFHWIKLFNQFLFKLCAAAETKQLQVFCMGKFIKEHKDHWQPGKPYYPTDEAATSIVSSLSRVFEHMAEKKLGIDITTSP